MKKNLVRILPFIGLLLLFTPTMASNLDFNLTDLELDDSYYNVNHWDKNLEYEDRARESTEFIFSEDDFRKMAREIIQVQRSISEEFSAGDGMTLALYIMKVFAEIGDYDLTQDEIRALFTTFTKLTQQEVPPVAYDIVDQLDRLQFVRRNAAASIIFHTRNRSTIMIDMSQYDESPDPAASSDLDKISIRHQSELSFHTIRTSNQKNELIEFIQTQFKLPILPRKWFSRFNQIYPGVEDRIRQYTQIDGSIEPLKVGIRGLSVNVDAGALLGQRLFEFNEAFLTPALFDHRGNPLPSFHLWASSGVLKVKTSIGE
jgi:hypothetical protein